MFDATVASSKLKTEKCPWDFLIRSLGTSESIISVVQWRQECL